MGREPIQSFDGAPTGKHATTGVFNTTSDFHKNALDYARVATPKIILINGQRLAKVMIKYSVGVSTMSIAFAGAGCPGGAVIGATDREGGDVTDALYTPYDYAETIYRKLGFSDNQRLARPNGVAVPLSDGGRAIRELF